MQPDAAQPGMVVVVDEELDICFEACSIDVDARDVV